MSSASLNLFTLFLGWFRSRKRWYMYFSGESMRILNRSILTEISISLREWHSSHDPSQRNIYVAGLRFELAPSWCKLCYKSEALPTALMDPAVKPLSCMFHFFFFGCCCCCFFFCFFVFFVVVVLFCCCCCFCLFFFFVFLLLFFYYYSVWSKAILLCYIWATTRQNVSSGVSDNARHKPAYAATDAS